MITNVDKSNEADTARDLKNEKVRRVVTLILQSAVLILQICVFTETVFLLFSGKAYFIGSGWTDESNILHATVYVLILYAVCEAAALIEMVCELFLKTSVIPLWAAALIMTLICAAITAAYARGDISSLHFLIRLYSFLLVLRTAAFVLNIKSLKRLRKSGKDVSE